MRKSVPERHYGYVARTRKRPECHAASPLVSGRRCFETVQVAPGGGGCAGVVPGMTNPGGN